MSDTRVVGNMNDQVRLCLSLNLRLRMKQLIIRSFSVCESPSPVMGSVNCGLFAKKQGALWR
jgi:hypothetical protein